MEWYLKVIKEYANFDGRARRKEYWMFVLFNTIISLLLMGLGTLVKFPALSTIYSVFVLLPSISVAVRRLHDIDKSGWMLLIGLIPLIGAIWLLVLFCTEGNSGINQYGSDPKNPTDELEEIGTSEA